MVGRGVDESYCTHLTEGHNPLLLETERESTKRKWGETEDTTTGDKTQGKTDVRYCRETCEFSHKKLWRLLLRLDWQTDRSTGKIFNGASNPPHRFIGFNSIFTKNVKATQGDYRWGDSVGYKGSYWGTVAEVRKVILANWTSCQISLFDGWIHNWGHHCWGQYSFAYKCHLKRSFT